MHPLAFVSQQKRCPRYWYLSVAVIRVSGTVEWVTASMRPTSIKACLQAKSSNRPLH